MSDRLPPTDQSFTVSVRQSHIDDGVRHNSLVCPIALAVSRAFPDVESVMVIGGSPKVEISINGYMMVIGGSPKVEISINGYTFMYRHDAGAFVWDFDDGKPVGPRSVTLSPFGQMALPERPEPF